MLFSNPCRFLYRASHSEKRLQSGKPILPNRFSMAKNSQPQPTKNQQGKTILEEEERKRLAEHHNAHQNQNNGDKLRKLCKFAL